MERIAVIQSLPGEIELLAKMHILYGLDRTPGFEAQRDKVRRIVSENRINPRTELDPISRNLYRRYF